MLSKEKKKLTIEEWLKVYNDLKNNTSLVESISTEPFIEFVDLLLSKIQQLETREQKLIDKIEERISDVEKCYNDLIEPYYDKTINMINTSFMTKKEKEEFINKRNCLLVQKQCYEEILSIVKGETHEWRTV